MNLTNTQQTILEAAATRPDGAIYPMPDRIKGGAALKVIKALADKGLIQDAGDNDWRIADEGFKAIGQEPQAEPPEESAEEERDPLTALFEQIALDHLFIDTLETRRSDRLDFHDVSVWGVKSALEAAYQAGMEAASKRTRKSEPRANSKQARMIEMMKRPEGATIRQESRMRRAAGAPAG